MADSSWIPGQVDSNLPGYIPSADEPYELLPPPCYRYRDHVGQASPIPGYDHVYTEKFSKKTKFTDVWATFLFCLQLSGFVYVSYMSITAMLNPRNDIIAHRGQTSPVVISRSFVGALGVSGIVGFLLSLVYFVLVEKFASVAIHATFLASIIFYFAFAAYIFLLKAPALAIMPITLGLISLICWAWWRSRIPFATVMLETVTGVSRKYKGMFGVTILGLIMQILYGVYFIVTFQGIIYMTHDNPEDCTETVNAQGCVSKACPNDGKRVWLILFAIFSYYWVHQVIKTTVHVTVSGVFGAEYFIEGTAEDVPTSPTLGSAKRALTTSFGSICFGSLILGVFRTLRALLRATVIETDNALFLFAGYMFACILLGIESLIQYFNHYAYAQVAIYGKNYCTAAKDTWALLQDRGVDALINDGLIGNVLTMGSFFVGGLTMLLSFMYVYVIGLPTADVIKICMFAFFVGYSMTTHIGEIIDSGMATTFVALAEDPDALARSNPVLFEQIRQTYPEVIYGV